MNLAIACFSAILKQYIVVTVLFFEASIMPAETISIEVDSETALVLPAAGTENRRKLDLLLSLRLRELTLNPPRAIQQIMDEVSRNAEERGLTPEILQTLLGDE